MRDQQSRNKIAQINVSKKLAVLPVGDLSTHTDILTGGQVRGGLIFFSIKSKVSSMSEVVKLRRVVLKVSGECFCPPKERGIAMSSVMLLAEQVARSAQEGIQIAIVMGGGNILRGGQFKASNVAILESTAHYMGMLATIINGLALQDAIELAGYPTRLMTALDAGTVAEPYIRRRAVRHLEKGRIILLAGGTGSPFVTTDTAAAQRALELNADALLKATKVDGVYSDDPEKNPQAVLYPKLTYEAVQQQKLRIMDQESIAKCGEHNMPVMIFNFRTPGSLERALRGERVGTLITNK